MSDHRDGLYSPTAVLSSTLTCGLCGARRRCTLEALVRSNRRGWPRCCGEVMTLTPVEPVEPAAHETATAAPGAPAAPVPRA
jgi:hypothetical protein